MNTVISDSSREPPSLNKSEWVRNQKTDVLFAEMFDHFASCNVPKLQDAVNNYDGAKLLNGIMSQFVAYMNGRKAQDGCLQDFRTNAYAHALDVFKRRNDTSMSLDALCLRIERDEPKYCIRDNESVFIDELRTAIIKVSANGGKLHVKGDVVYYGHSASNKALKQSNAMTCKGKEPITLAQAAHGRALHMWRRYAMIDPTEDYVRRFNAWCKNNNKSYASSQNNLSLARAAGVFG